MRYLLLAIPFLFGFTYPVDLDQLYIPYSVSAGDVVGKPRAWPRADGMAIEGADPDVIPLMAVEGDKPIYDPDTHHLEPSFVIDLPAEEYRREWVVTNHSAEELAEIAEEAEIAAEAEQAKAVYLDLKNGVGNNGDRLVRVEKALAHVLRRMYQP